MRRFGVTVFALLLAVGGGCAAVESDEDLGEGEDAITTVRYVTVHGQLVEVTDAIGYGDKHTLVFPERQDRRGVRFYGRKGDEITVWVHGPANDSSTLWLASSKSELVATGGGTADGTRDRLLTFTLPRRGTYVIGVEVGREGPTTRSIALLGPTPRKAGAVSAPGSPETVGGVLEGAIAGSCTEYYACPIGDGSSAQTTGPARLGVRVTGTAQAGYRLILDPDGPGSTNAMQSFDHAESSSIVVDRSEPPDFRYITNTPNGDPIYGKAYETPTGISVAFRVPAGPQSPWLDPNRYPAGCHIVPRPGLGAYCEGNIVW